MKKLKKAIIIGVNGQDGRLLFDLLARLNYQIIGLDKNSLKTEGIAWKKKIDINKKEQVEEIIKKIKPEEIYHLAAFHQSSQDKALSVAEELAGSYQINTFSLLNFLEAIRLYSPQSKIFFAGSSLMFGACKTKYQTENTPYKPDSVYGLTKSAGAALCRMYREKYKIFAAVGIMYNHESEYRSDNFISMKIIKGARDIASGKQKNLVIGDLYAAVDWGYAPDYVAAMHKILNLKKADDFIVASGQAHSVLHLVKIAFGHYGLDYRKYIKEDERLLTRKRATLIGNAQKLKMATGWKPSVNFEQMIKKIITAVEQK